MRHKPNNAKKNGKAGDKPIGGPFLAAAIFCDSIVHGSDGALSVTRIVDKITLTIPVDAPKNVPSEEHKLLVSTWVLLMFKSGDAKGKRHKVSLAINSPSGDRTEGPNQDVVLSKNPSGGANLRIGFNVAVKDIGLFIVDVLLDGKIVTRMPLDVQVVRDENVKLGDLLQRIAPPNEPTTDSPAPKVTDAAKKRKHKVVTKLAKMAKLSK